MPFAGTYDGQGYAIDGLFMAHPDEMNNGVGLFNHTDEEAVIKNLHLTNVDISAFWDVGALVGRNRGLIDNCYASGKVEGIANSVGGLAGYNNYDGIITNSGANMTLGVTGEQHVGGLVGNNDGQMTDWFNWHTGHDGNPKQQPCLRYRECYRRGLWRIDWFIQ